MRITADELESLTFSTVTLEDGTVLTKVRDEHGERYKYSVPHTLIARDDKGNYWEFSYTIDISEWCNHTFEGQEGKQVYRLVKVNTSFQEDFVADPNSVLSLARRVADNYHSYGLVTGSPPRIYESTIQEVRKLVTLLEDDDLLHKSVQITTNFAAYIESFDQLAKALEEFNVYPD